MGNRRSAILGESGYKRKELDSYFTIEPWVTRALLDKIQLRQPVWECAAGRGHMSIVLREYGHDPHNSDIVSHPDPLDTIHEHVDFLACDRPWGGTIITNPPAILSEQFVQRALALTGEMRGMVCMLLRHEWDCAGTRKYLFETPFARKVILTKRPRWTTENKASPRHNWAWFVWDWQHEGPPIIQYAP